MILLLEVGFIRHNEDFGLVVVWRSRLSDVLGSFYNFAFILVGGKHTCDISGQCGLNPTGSTSLFFLG